VIYGSGRISSRVLEWLANQAADDFHLVHFPDYDPVGLCEFIRLKRALGSRVSLYIPNGLGERFKQSSKRSLLFSHESQRVLARVRRSKVPSVRFVLDFIDENNAGLEQEQLLIDASQKLQVSHQDVPGARL